MSARQIEIAKEYVERLWNEKDVSFVDEYCTEDYRVEPLWSNFMIPPQALEEYDDGGKMINRQVAKDIVNMWITVLPDMRFITDDVIAEENKVMTLHTAVATRLGPMFGEPPRELGREASVRAILINYFRPGEEKIFKTNTFWDFWQILVEVDAVHSAYRIIGAKIPERRVPAQA